MEGDSRARLGLRTYALLNAACLAAVMFLLLFSMSLYNSVTSALQSRAAEISIQMVLKPEVSEKGASEICLQINETYPRVKAKVVPSRDTEAMLSLQEPWMRELQDVEVGQIPVIISINHPDVLVAPEKVTSFVDLLKSRPEADFVIFNTAGLDQFARVVNVTQDYGLYAVQAIAVSSAFCFLLLNLVLSIFKRKHGPGTAVLLACIICGVGTGVGWILFRLVIGYGTCIYSVAPPRPWDQLALVVLVFCGCLLLEMKDVRMRRRNREQASA